jgi:hypothetical protein
MEAALFQRPLSVGGIIVPIEYQSRVFTAGGAIPATGRAINIYLQVTSIATPSLLCACDSYQDTKILLNGKLFNIIPE